MKTAHCFLGLLLFFLGTALQAQTFWTGPKVKFSKANFADWTLEANQDRITDSVWITRADRSGIFNIAREAGFNRESRSSPIGTEWAVGQIADGIENLEFTTWVATNSNPPPEELNINKVLHLIEEDIYIDIKFTAWTPGGGGSGTGMGGGFAYERSSPGPDTDNDGDGFDATEDCNDNNPEVNPDQDEIPYNGLDDDCNPDTRDDDLDGDGFVAADDCNDGDAMINPDQTEIPFNGLDDDCNPNTLDDDADQDGYNTDSDCNDNDPNINPGQSEIPYNGIDDDCNPNTPDDDLDGDGFNNDTDCNDNNADINPDQNETPYNGIDDDCNPNTPDDDLDGDGFNNDTDCNDNNADINPDQSEIPNNDIDENCDGADLVTSTYQFGEGTVTIYPNPVKRYLKITTTNTSMPYSAHLLNATGKVVSAVRDAPQMDLSGISPGLYWLVIRGRKSTERVVRQIAVIR